MYNPHEYQCLLCLMVMVVFFPTVSPVAFWRHSFLPSVRPFVSSVSLSLDAQARGRTGVVCRVGLRSGGCGTLQLGAAAAARRPVELQPAAV